MESILADFHQAHIHLSGPLLASTLDPLPSPLDVGRLKTFYYATDQYNVERSISSYIGHGGYPGALSLKEINAWVDIYVAYWKVVADLLSIADFPTQGLKAKGDWIRVYDSWKEVAHTLIRGYNNAEFQAWTVPCLYVIGKYLRVFAIKADVQAVKEKGNVTFNEGFQDDIVGAVDKNEKLEDAARVINRIFQLCISDRAPWEESRKWGLYYTTNLLFKTYFKLNSIGLSKNILRALKVSQTDMPPLEAFPKSHIVTFKYYVGVISFLEENYPSAEEHLTHAYLLCHRASRKNLELILTYLIPTHLLTTHTLPSAALLAPYPRLQTLFSPLISAIKAGDLAGFDRALSAGEDEFVKRRIYLTLERGRDVAMRNLLRRVYVAGGWVEAAEGQKVVEEGRVGEDGKMLVRRTRVPVDEFVAAVRLGASPGGGGGGEKGVERDVDRDEVECLLANMIYKNFMKGYINRERGFVVLSHKGNAFPGTGI